MDYRENLMYDSGVKSERSSTFQYEYSDGFKQILGSAFKRMQLKKYNLEKASENTREINTVSPKKICTSRETPPRIDRRIKLPVLVNETKQKEFDNEMSQIMTRVVNATRIREKKKSYIKKLQQKKQTISNSVHNFSLQPWQQYQQQK